MRRLPSATHDCKRAGPPDPGGAAGSPWCGCRRGAPTTSASRRRGGRNPWPRGRHRGTSRARGRQPSSPSWGSPNRGRRWGRGRAPRAPSPRRSAGAWHPGRRARSRRAGAGPPRRPAGTAPNRPGARGRRGPGGPGGSMGQHRGSGEQDGVALRAGRGLVVGSVEDEGVDTDDEVGRVDAGRAPGIRGEWGVSHDGDPLDRPAGGVAEDVLAHLLPLGLTRLIEFRPEHGAQSATRHPSAGRAPEGPGRYAIAPARSPARAGGVPPPVRCLHVRWAPAGRLVVGPRRCGWARPSAPRRPRPQRCHGRRRERRGPRPGWDVPVLDDDELAALVVRTGACVALGVGDDARRTGLLDWAEGRGLALPPVVASTATVAASATLGAGRRRARARARRTVRPARRRRRRQHRCRRRARRRVGDGSPRRTRRRAPRWRVRRVGRRSSGSGARVLPGVTRRVGGRRRCRRGRRRRRPRRRPSSASPPAPTGEPVSDP